MLEKYRRRPKVLEVKVLLEGQSEALTQVTVDKALEGDTTALRLCLDRIAPPRKDAPISFNLPDIETPKDAAKAARAILKAVADGDGGMSGLKGRLKKLEQKDAPGERIDVIIWNVFEPGENGPVETGEALAVIPGLDAPQVIKSLNETHEEFSIRVRELSKQAKGIDEMSDDALKAAIAALNEIIVEANALAEQGDAMVGCSVGSA